ncbi:hypothetical protein LCGC14_1589650, partial [marine sediment metagenome]
MQQQRQESQRCALCPAGCELALVRAGPDKWRIEYPSKGGQGVCPRGSALGELLTHYRRIVAPAQREGGRLTSVTMSSAVQRILDAAGDKLVLLLDGNVPVEQMAAAAAWCRDFPAARLCLVVEPAEDELLLGAEASDANYLADRELAGCDGFVIIGDAFAANPVCSRGVFDRRRADARTPIIAIDAARGTPWKFASHPLPTPPGAEFAVLGALAAAAGVGAAPSDAPPCPAVAEAGKAIATCKRLAVLVAAEHGRGGIWRQIGYAAGRLAKALGGGLAVQTAGANALAAVRMAGRLGTVSLAKALAEFLFDTA